MIIIFCSLFVWQLLCNTIAGPNLNYQKVTRQDIPVNRYEPVYQNKMNGARGYTITTAGNFVKPRALRCKTRKREKIELDGRGLISVYKQ